jgi:hypothetical protein
MSARQALLASLDAHTLRDIGLGDWAPARREEGSTFSIELDLPRF